MTLVHFDLTIHLESAFHIQAGFGAEGLHQSMVRNRKQDPVIPASSIKGRLRYNAVRFGGVLAEHMADAETWYQPAMQCLFGDENHAGGLFIDNATLANAVLPKENDPPLREIRASNMIDRRTGSVVDGHLRFYEALPARLQFTTKVDVHLPKRWQEPGVERADFQDALLVLLAAIRLCDRMGAGKTRGTGRVRLDVGPFSLKDEYTKETWHADKRQAWLTDVLQQRLPEQERAS